MKLLKKIIKLFFNTFHWLRKKYWKIFNIKTFGVRVLLHNEGKIFLVKHRYGNFWVMPGGGIEKGEQPEKAVARELKEEAGIILKKIDFQLGYYANNSGGKNDHVYCFVATDFEMISNFKRKFIDYLEISDANWFDIDALPEKISPATKRRINEFLEKKRDLVTDW